MLCQRSKGKCAVRTTSAHVESPLWLIPLCCCCCCCAGINVAQIVILAPLFVFCWYMRQWETQDLVPIRPMEGEELPANMVRAGPSQRSSSLSPDHSLTQHE